MRAFALLLLAIVAAAAADLPYCKIAIKTDTEKGFVEIVGWWDARHRMLFKEKADPFSPRFPAEQEVKVMALVTPAPKQPEYIAKVMSDFDNEDAAKAARAAKEKQGHPPTGQAPAHPKP